MLTFVDTLSTWYEQVKALPKPTLVAPMKMGSKARGSLPRRRRSMPSTEHNALTQPFRSAVEGDTVAAVAFASSPTA
jgi:hypothetical protein